MAASRHLINKLRETLGREAGEDLMTWLEEERTERKGLRLDFAALRSDFATLRSDFARIEARFETFVGQVNSTVEKQNTAIEKMSVRLEQGLKEQTRFFFLAWAVQLAAIVGLYAR